MTNWAPSGRLAWLRLAAAVKADMRAFFAEREVTEVTTPVLTDSSVTEPQIQSLALADGGGFLRTSPEYFHKRLLAAGFGDLYELGPVMRDGERGRLHRREFTLLEWYRVNWNWRQLADETTDLLTRCFHRVGRGRRIRRVAWRQLYVETLALDPLDGDEQALHEATAELPADCDRQMRLDFLMSTRIQPQLPPDQLTVVHHFPAEQAALAQLDPDDERLALRFEVFAGPVELANGYQELLDPVEQRARFDRDNERRRVLGLPPMPIDEALLSALASGLPPCSGIALGFDRLMMVLVGTDEISDVVAFD